MNLVVNILVLLFANSILAALVWKLIRVKTRILRAIGSVFAAICCFANLLLAGISIRELWLEGADWYYIVLLLLGLVFGFRFGGGISAGHR